MTISTTTHLNFHGDARRALEFYAGVFGGETTIATYGDFGMPAEAPGAQDVVFGQIHSADGFRIMAYDVPGARTTSEGAQHRTRRENGTTITDAPFFVSVRGSALDEVERYWAALSADGTVVEQLGASAWSPGFGMLTDRFGVTWILDVEPSTAG